MRKAVAIIIPVALCFAFGFAASLIQRDAIISWYPTLVKPPLTPPNYVFPTAWGVIYLLAGISMGLAWNADGGRRKIIAALFAAQLAFNFLWSVLFFYMRSPMLGLADIVVLECVIIAYALAACRVSKPASLLFVPYAAWVAFAAYLNAYILAFN